MNPSRKISVVFVLPFLALVGCTTTVRQNPNFAARRSQISAVAVMPPEVKVRLITFKGDNPPLPDDEANLRGRLPGVVAKALEAHGFRVQSPDVLQTKLTQSPELRLLTTEVNDSLLQAANEAYASGTAMRTSSAESYQRSLGPAAASLADKASADALVFADIRGFRKSGGEIAWNMASSLMQGMLSLGSFVPVYPSKGAALLITLVDGPSGDVLWQNVAATQNVDFVAPGVVESMVEQAFAKLPGDSGAEATADARSIAATRTAVAASADGAAPPSDPSSAAKEGVR